MNYLQTDLFKPWMGEYTGYQKVTSYFKILIIVKIIKIRVKK